MRQKHGIEFEKQSQLECEIPFDECRLLTSIVEDQGGLAWSPNLNKFPK